MSRQFLETLLGGLVPPGFLEIAVLNGGVMQRRYFQSFDAAEEAVKLAPDGDVFYGPAARSRREGKKDAFLATRVLWADVDHDEPIDWIFPPSIVVRSGTGNHRHLYWLLDEKLEDSGALAEILSDMAAMLPSDKASTDPTRLLRVPGTRNSGNACEIVAFDEKLEYSLKDIRAALRIDPRVTEMILTGKVPNRLPSRSERDFWVMCEARRCGMSEDGIRLIFEAHPVGEVVREEGDHYFYLTLGKASADVDSNGGESSTSVSTSVVQKRTGMVIQGRSVANFGIEPLAIVKTDDADLIWTRVTTDSGEFEHMLKKSNLSTPQSFQECLPAADAVFSGKIAHLRQLLIWLSRPEIPRIVGIDYVGRWETKPLWVTSKSVLGPDGIIDDPPVVCISRTAKNIPLHYTLGERPEELSILADALPNINYLGVVLPIIGWHAAAVYKSCLAEIEYKFPILNIHGTRGSGKTSVISLFQRLAGYSTPQHMDIVSTQFVQLRRSGDVSSIPIHWAEYRSGLPESVSTRIVRYLQMLYDAAKDARGHPDLTMSEFDLRAPVVVDGEEPLTEPALRERMIQVNLSPNAIGNTSFSEAFNRIAFSSAIWNAFAGSYVCWSLANPIPMDDARQIVYRNTGSVFMAERVRKNLEVVVGGLLSINNFFLARGLDFLDTSQIQAFAKEYIQESVLTRRLQVDDFIQDLIFLFERGKTRLTFRKDGPDGTVLWFHLPSVYPEWARLSRSIGRPVFNKDALMQQLNERGDFIIRAEMDIGSYGGLTLYGIVLAKAKAAGLDVPTEIRGQT